MGHQEHPEHPKDLAGASTPSGAELPPSDSTPVSQVPSSTESVSQPKHPAAPPPPPDANALGPDPASRIAPPAAPVAPPTPHAAAAPQPTPRTLLENLASISQLALVVLAAFGYFYTVIPVYQKERLSEEIAKKQIEFDRLEIANKDTRANLDKLAAQLSHLDIEKQALESALSERAKALDALQFENETHRAQYDSARETLSRLQAERDRTEGRLSELKLQLGALESDKTKAEHSLAEAAIVSTDIFSSNLDRIGRDLKFARASAFDEALVSGLSQLDFRSMLFLSFGPGLGESIMTREEIKRLLGESGMPAEITRAQVVDFLHRHDLPPLEWLSNWSTSLDSFMRGEKSTLSQDELLTVFWYAPHPELLTVPSLDARLEIALRSGRPMDISVPDATIVAAEGNAYRDKYRDFIKAFDEETHKEIARRSDTLRTYDQSMNEALARFKQERGQFSSNSTSAKARRARQTWRAKWGHELKKQQLQQSVIVAEILTVAHQNTVARFKPMMVDLVKGAWDGRLNLDSKNNLSNLSVVKAAFGKVAWWLKCDGEMDRLLEAPLAPGLTNPAAVDMDCDSLPGADDHDIVECAPKGGAKQVTVQLPLLEPPKSRGACRMVLIKEPA